MESRDNSENLAPPPPAPQSSLLSVLILAIVLGLVWFAALPQDSNALASDRMRLSLAIIVALIAVAGWGLVLASKQNQRAGQIAEERDLFFSLSLDILGVLGLSGRFERINPAVLNILGLKPETLTEGMSLLDIAHPEDTQLATSRLQELAAGRPVNFELRCRCGDGSWRWLSWSANPALDEARIYVVAHDITERKASEELLRADSSFRQAMENSVLTGMQAVAPDGRILHVNRAFAELVGWSAEELAGQAPPYVFWPEEDREQNRQRLRQCMQGQASREGLELVIRRRNGARVDVRLHLSPLVDNQGEQTGWMTAMTDITEQKRARTELQAANERITTVLDGLDAAVYVSEAGSGELLYTNRAFDAQHTRVGESCLLVVPQPELGDYPGDPRKLGAADVPRELFDGELQHPFTGQWFHLRERALRWVDGRIVRLGVATDITALKRAEELTREQEQRLARTSRLITMGEMASTLAHELNQPLSAIANYSSGCVNRLKSGQFQIEDILGAMEKASTQANRAGNIVRRIRDFVRKSEPRRSLISIRQVTEEALGIAEIEARRLGTRILTSLPDDLPDVLADRIMIEQVLMNLIKNAAEAMQGIPLDERVIHIEARHSDDYIEVSVADRGCGISTASLDELFSPFFTTKQDGMGMGLNICRSIIEFHKGRLWVDANPTGGSIFRFTLALEKSLESHHDT
ncbi:PAS domain S-box protein [Uliginosibacterium sp. 31-12]|uniref:PAS domain-containing sensor histidine kinase n=1 Tax=Uliginosibacterium sp. 31-12 TaxID=3062781 RepID=UPI0026E32BD6|nr:PAS domain S-box protein [Uliginosibacterium sp. 31-12]MDO6387924.1 PAS domain S-box protein [Uliginosibacterium sp. 31-12]